ncbi:hypothetical protein MG293_020844 [Ovis ammon polii]|uniref:Uncharacterized protein n=1 Tax=Ovis ammon polii TaxID=230172 RepID=A0AAD4TMU5_OVIAM|nr:hypothetical protein MG293_020844 [Ovis ammon polii]KAI4550024.1 hypothetical protein MJT46_019173 [Ovis ammon polii x Ovis aries]
MCSPPVSLKAVEAAAAELALESPPGHLDHVIQQHGQCLLAAGARASPVHAEEVQGGGAEHQEDPEGGAAGLCRGLGGELHLESGHLGRFVLHLGQMGNLPHLPLWRIHMLPHTAPKQEEHCITQLTAQFLNLPHL